MRVVTTGMIDPGACRWGSAVARFGKRRWLHPWLDAAALSAADPRIGRWVARLAVPKVLVASQTRVVEAVADQRGDVVPVTPTIAVLPARGDDLDLVVAALVSPPVAAWMRRRRAGSGMSAAAVRIGAADLLEVPLEEPPPPDLEIVPVSDAGTLDEFLRVIAADWLEWTDGETTPVQQRTLDAWRSQIPPKLAGEPVPLRWIGRLDGTVVATSRISIGAGVAGLYAITTQPLHRGKGYGRAMTIAALRAARRLDYRIGVLQASDLGYSVYRRLGFRDLFSYAVFVHPGGGEP
jgi:GNAT superfamily N-acetyltransferase